MCLIVVVHYFAQLLYLETMLYVGSDIRAINNDTHLTAFVWDYPGEPV